jgi:hypothetical protein
LQNGTSVLGIAAHCGHLEVVKYLCKLGNKKLMALRDKSGVSPVGDARSQGHTAVVKFLRSLGMQG